MYHSSMKHSEYIHWVKRHFPGVRYNLGFSGVSLASPAALGATAEDLLDADPNGDGWPPLVARIATRYGAPPESVVVTHGASMANHLTCAALLDPGDEVVLEHPVYEPLRAVPAYLRARVVPVERPVENGWALDLDALRAAVSPRTRLIIVTNLHNPTGAHVDAGTMAEIVRLAEEHGTHLLVDEVYLEFLHAEGETGAAGLSPLVVTTRSLTKAFGLGYLRLGWVLADPPLAERMRRLHDLFAGGAAHPSERLAAVALRNADTLLASTNERLRRHVERVDDFITAHPRLEWRKPPAGTVGFVHLLDGSVDELVDRLRLDHDALVTPGRFFGRADHFRIGWGVATEVVEGGLERLAAALASVKSP